MMMTVMPQRSIERAWMQQVESMTLMIQAWQ